MKITHAFTASFNPNRTTRAAKEAVEAVAKPAPVTLLAYCLKENEMVEIEVANDKGHNGVKTGQLLKIIHESKCFFWVKGFDGVEYQVNKKTRRIHGTRDSFIHSDNQPLVNF
jgi:hypothetical protein